MKKYISIMSLSAVFFIQSCERTDSELNASESEYNREIMDIHTNKEYERTDKDIPENTFSENFDTGDDDEPRRDKQHWRMTDTIRWSS